MPSTPEQLIDQATRHAVHLEGLKTHETRLLVETLEDINASLVSKLARAKDTSTWTIKRTNDQIRTYKEMLAEKYAQEMAPALRKATRDLAVYESEFELRSLGEGAPKYQFTLPTEGQIMASLNNNPLTIGGRFNGTLLGELHSEFAAQQISTLTRALRAAAVGGITTPELLRSLRDETFPLNRRQLEAVARTSLQHAAAQARRATFEANADIIKGYRIIATLDGRTSTECQVRDGTIEPMDNPQLPPYHFNCRTTFTAALDDRFAILEEDGTRAARDPETGKIERVPAKETYYGWLKKQPTTFQDDVLGPARGKLFREGGLSAERFKELQLDRNFKPRSLDEMRRIEPLAFQRIDA